MTSSIIKWEINIHPQRSKSQVTFFDFVIPFAYHSEDDDRLIAGVVPFEANVDYTRTIKNVKSLLGQKPEVEIPMKGGGTLRKTPVELASLVFSELKNNAEIALGGSTYGVVVPVPANWGDAQRQAMKGTFYLCAVV